MSPEEFMEKWQVDKRELAQLLDLSYAQVERWFFKSGKNKSEPRVSQLKRLSEIDYLLKMLDFHQNAIYNCPLHIRELKNKVADSHQNDVSL